MMLRLAGLLIAGTGVAHFAAPELFTPITKAAFPENTREWTYGVGAVEVGLGLAVAGKKTRLAGLAGTAAYAYWLTSRVRAGRSES